MGIETSMARKKGKGKELSELDKQKNQILSNPKSNSNSREGGKKARRKYLKKMASTSPLQKLYDTCKEVFRFSEPGVVPPPDKIEKLRTVLDELKPEDVGLSPEMPYFRPPPPGTNAIRYLHLHECNKFSIGIFCFPPSGVIPLHNHPGMTVFSKLLFGKMHIKSYDWVVDGQCNSFSPVNPSEAKQLAVQLPEVQQPELKQPDLPQPELKQPDVQQPALKQPQVQQLKPKQPDIKEPPVRLAKIKINSDFIAPCNPSILYPADGGNMHCFTAATACAVLDVLGPPYSNPEGRHCTYYADFPFANFLVDGVCVPEEERDGCAWLQEIGQQPEGFKMVGEMYRGPQILQK